MSENKSHGSLSAESVILLIIVIDKEINMFESNSLMTRIAVGKLLGAIIGVTAFFFIPQYLPDASVTLHWGVFLWYITFGAIIGVFGIYTKMPIINVATPWWIRGAYIGAWLNLIISLIAYDDLAQLMVSIFGQDGLLSSPYWMVLEGAVFGFLIDYFATRFGGEGAELIK